MEPVQIPCPDCGSSFDLSSESQESCPYCSATLVIQGKYKIHSMLGKGGMSVVYGARRLEDDRQVAIKVMSLRLGEATSWKGFELFERGTRILQGLEHPQLPKVHGFFKENEKYVLVTERFFGGSLHDRIAREHRHLDPQRFEQLAESLLRLLTYLQGLQPPVLHRDIKPQNIMFRTPADWEPVLVDFDTPVAQSGSGPSLTVVGTPEYAAPEQLMGDASLASDVFSLGVTLLFTATHEEPSKLPRKGGRFRVADRLGNLPQHVRTVLERMVEPTVEKRYQAAAKALLDLETIRQAPAMAPPHGAPSGPHPPGPAPYHSHGDPRSQPNPYAHPGQQAHRSQPAHPAHAQTGRPPARAGRAHPRPHDGRPHSGPPGQYPHRPPVRRRGSNLLLIGCGIGLFLILVGGASMFFLCQHIFESVDTWEAGLQNVEGMGEVAQINEENRRANPFARPVDDRIEEEQLLRYLEVRKLVHAAYNANRKQADEFMDDTHLLKSDATWLGDMKLGVCRTLQREQMSPDEYAYYTMLIYFAWYEQRGEWIYSRENQPYDDENASDEDLRRAFNNALLIAEDARQLFGHTLENSTDLFEAYSEEIDALVIPGRIDALLLLGMYGTF